MLAVENSTAEFQSKRTGGIRKTLRIVAELRKPCYTLVKRPLNNACIGHIAIVLMNSLSGLLNHSSNEALGKI